ncbi:hypothetical protein AB0C70_27480 [Streptomyces sp. NPDC048564]|uniref:hypothetical protein n=1 Tax=unclassified Streptomyces TaxID=2593676 RepID=UPI003432F5F3
MTQAKAILIGAGITAGGALVAALLTGVLSDGSTKTNACKNEQQVVQNCGENNQINIGPSAATSTPSKSAVPSEGDGAASN